jgi:hypothetical protein
MAGDEKNQRLVRLSVGSFCSTEQALDIQVETPSLGRIHVWSRNQTTMNPTIHHSSAMTPLLEPMDLTLETGGGPHSFCVSPKDPRK